MDRFSLEKNTDDRLLELIKIDDEPAFAEIYNRYWKKVLTVAIHKTSDVVEAENIVQDIFQSLWQRRNDLQIHTSLDNYLMVSTKYRVIKFLNRQRQQRLFESSGLLNIDILDDSTQEYLAFEELKGRLEVLVAQLPQTCQLVYRLNKEEGKSYKEIAETMGISEKAVDGHLSRAKKKLRSRLDSDLNSFFL
ncbi:MAG: RNA polymerase sigma-70 factor [Pedobacter sp.]